MFYVGLERKNSSPWRKDQDILTIIISQIFLGFTEQHTITIPKWMIDNLNNHTIPCIFIEYDQFMYNNTGTLKVTGIGFCTNNYVPEKREVIGIYRLSELLQLHNKLSESTSFKYI